MGKQEEAYSLGEFGVSGTSSSSRRGATALQQVELGIEMKDGGKIVDVM